MSHNRGGRTASTYYPASQSQTSHAQSSQGAKVVRVPIAPYKSRGGPSRSRIGYLFSLGHLNTFHDICGGYTRWRAPQLFEAP